MRLMFWKPEPEPEKLYIPEEHIEKVLELCDDFYSLQVGKDHEAKFHLWRKIFKTLDIPINTEDTYVLNTKNATRPFIVLNLKKG